MAVGAEVTNELRKSRRRAVSSSLARSRAEGELQKALAARDAQIQKLSSQLEAGEVARQLAIREALGNVEKERDEVRSQLQRMTLEKELAEKSLKDKYETQIRDRDGTPCGRKQPDCARAWADLHQTSSLSLRARADLPGSSFFERRVCPRPGTRGRAESPPG